MASGPHAGRPVSKERTGISRATYPIIGALVALALCASSASALTANTSLDQCRVSPITNIDQFRQFSAKVWELRTWERGRPAPAAIRAKRLAAACGGQEIRRIWSADRKRYLEHRRKMLFRQRVTPHFGCTTQLIAQPQTSGRAETGNACGLAGADQVDTFRR